MPNQQFTIDANQPGQRIDILLVKKYGKSRNYWQNLIKQGLVRVNAKAIKSSYLTEPTDIITIQEPEAANILTAETTPIVPIIYQDSQLLIVDKPAGLLVHAVQGQTAQPTLAQFAALHSNDPDPDRPGIVHRLDRDTSGLMIIAKTPQAKAFLQEQFKARKVKKTYQMLVLGHLKQTEALIDLPLGRKSDTAKRIVLPSGHEAKTYYKVLAEFSKFSLVEAYPKTGRTHQLRVHFAHLGHSIVGDYLYGKPAPAGLDRMFLHATDIEFTSPDGRELNFHSPLPPQLQQFLLSLS